MPKKQTPTDVDGTEESPKAQKRKAKKRADREGTLYFDAKRKLWVGEVMVGYRADGKPDIRRTTARRQDDCKAKLDGIKAKAAGGLLPDAERRGETLAALLSAWLTSVRPDIRTNTDRRYEQCVRFHFLPALGAIKLSELKAARIQQFLAVKRTAPREKASSKREDGHRPLTARTVQQLYVVLNTALRWGLRKGFISVNPCDRVDPPRVERREIQPLSPEQTAKLLSTAAEAGDTLLGLWEMAAFTGARQGELLALRWSDVDLNEGRLTIRRTQVATRKGGAEYNPTKSKDGYRVLDLAPDAVAALRAHQDRQKWVQQKLREAYGDPDLVFASAVGTPLQATNVSRRFKALLAVAGLPTSTRFHDLRHGAATMMLAAGEDAPTVSQYLGHSTPAVTMSIYAHVVPGAKRRAATRLADTIRQARTP
ncbi:MAG: site-specific integrase [Chloroflexi bacterium]|nr:site-specific integrase [Chloroflexota bacterium]